jgi:hypothetical protein
MRDLRLLTCLLTLAACGPSEEDFQDTFPADLCAYVETCTTDSAEEDGDPVEATCEEAMVATLAAFSGDDTCTYDSAQAQACLDAIDAGDCDAAETVESTCAAVYTGDACNLTISDYL